jgi:hypothetical protein
MRNTPTKIERVTHGAWQPHLNWNILHGRPQLLAVPESNQSSLNRVLTPMCVSVGKRVWQFLGEKLHI